MHQLPQLMFQFRIYQSTSTTSMRRELQRLCRSLTVRRDTPSTEADGRTALSIRTVRRPLRHIRRVDLRLARSDVESVYGAFEHGESGEGLVIGDFVTGIVDAGESERAGLFHLAVGEGVRGADVDVAGCGGAGTEEGVVDCFAAEPVGWLEVSLV